MRHLFSFICVAILSSFGCSAIVAARGERLNEFKSREQVRKTFGTPLTEGVERQQYEEFRTHRKISDVSREDGICIATVVTFGFSEFISLPRELFRAAQQRTDGQTIRFVYDEDGSVVSVLVNGTISGGCGGPLKQESLATPKPRADLGTRP